MILIEHQGERLLVTSLEGYPKATVIAADIDPPPSDYCEFKSGKWVENAAAKAAAAERARLAALSRAELVEEVVRKIRAESANR